MPQAFRCTNPVVPAWAGMGMHGSAVSRNRKVFPWYETGFHGRQDSHMIEEALQPPFKVKRDILPAHEPFFDSFCDFGLCLLCFLFFAFGLIRLLLFQEAGSSLLRAYKSVGGAVQGLSTQRVRDSLAKPSENRRKKRIKDLKICGWFLAGLPVLE